MRWAFAAIIAIHGLIHLMGPAETFGYADLPQLTQPISRGMGLVWIAAAVVTLATVVALFVWPRGWWMIGAVALVLSQAAIFTSWSDAKAGTMANMLLLAVVAYGYFTQGPTSFRAQFDRDVRAGLARPVDAPVLTEADVTPLPNPVRRYLRATGMVGQPLIRNVALLAVAIGAGGGAAPPLAASPARASQAATQPPHDVFAFVRALDEAAARGVWPGFSPSGIPIALYDGERTVLLRHPSPPPEFSPMPGRPGVLVAGGRYPAVTSNSTREIGGVRTATVIATPAEPVERTMLAVVEEVFHVFWLAGHPSFRPNEMARYAYPLDDAENLGRLAAEDEALARALEAPRLDAAADWAAAALAIRRERVPRLAEDVRAYETSLEMMEGTANYVARVSVGEPSSRTVERLRTPRPAEDIRWRFYDTGAALCLLLDRVRPGWQERSEPPAGAHDGRDQWTKRCAAAMLRPRVLGRRARRGSTHGRPPTSRTSASAGSAFARLDRAPRRPHRDRGEAGAEPFRVQRFDPINLMVLDAGASRASNYLTLLRAAGDRRTDQPGLRARRVRRHGERHRAGRPSPVERRYSPGDDSRHQGRPERRRRRADGQPGGARRSPDSPRRGGARGWRTHPDHRQEAPAVSATYRYHHVGIPTPLPSRA